MSVQKPEPPVADAPAGANQVGKRFLRAVVAPGQRAFRAAGWAETVQSLVQIAQWAALAKLVDHLLSNEPSEAWLFAAFIGLAGVLAATCRWIAKLQSDRGAAAVAQSLRKQALMAVLPDVGQRTTAPQSGASAYATFTHIDDIADYCAATEAPRRAVMPTMVLILVAVALIHWPVALLLAGATALMPGNMRLAGLASLDASRQRLREIDRLGAVVLESFRGMQALRSLGAFERRQAQIAVVAARLNTLTMQVLGKAFLSTLVMDVVVTFAIAVCATYVGLVLLDYLVLGIAPKLTLFSGMLVLLLCPMYFLPIRRVAAGFHARDRVIAAAEAVEAVLSPHVASDKVQQPPATLPGPVLLRTNHLSYRLPGRDEPLLDQVSVTADLGKLTVITGASGAGKTTLLNLLAGILVPQQGGIQWINASGERLEPDVRAAAWIGQNTVIVDGTVASNIALGDSLADMSRIHAAAQMAGLGELLRRLDQGLDTRIGDGGAGVSAGEARRIAIARALLRKTSVWFLDEPTAHLDPATERDVLNAIEQVTAGQTVIAVTHSPELIARADTLWSLRDGQVHVIRSPAEQRV